jgi:hypothetical protein
MHEAMNSIPDCKNKTEHISNKKQKQAVSAPSLVGLVTLELVHHYMKSQQFFLWVCLGQIPYSLQGSTSSSVKEG